ncbi:restriction endonuclease subunit S [Lactobacillus jensenii]|jgi:restriction modification system DNA specificity domain protein|uniref:Restriction endonuclease subunit S n=2 Tax=Lactobacillus jensenii TaxID=109790 RepID=A0A5N1IC92_LACJE|nr:restriction endonuclease subunit S [Lactobacillus jensenii]EEQ67675.1 type I restriction modification DNA specificity domain protein [Lactobacillus jensenii 1153]APT15159.1 restriction endonuclease [Lactobacillus jensenii]EEQ24084.1 type I restriction modification DNA specificity domain protein [Lactobacillus jensenii 269-3]EEX26816.1 type I restriction modification DNA specificity domain protein [Lactobacillus jensenii SJ-7A-US]KAA9235910.1 restriction endonuclease subunit S [Lactobacillus
MKYKVSQIAEINSNSIKPKLYSGALNYEDTSSVTDNCFIRPIRYDNITEAPSRARRKAAIGDTVISTVRPNNLHYGFIDKNNCDWIYSTGFAVVHPDKKIVDPFYLFLLLSLKSTTQKLQDIGETSKSTYPAVKPDDIANLQFEIPSLEKQKKISFIFKNLYQKSKLNNQINDNLDDLMTTIFNNKIINSKFEVSSLTNIANYKNGLAMQKFRPTENSESLPVLKIRELNQGSTDNNSDRCSANIDPEVIVNTGDIIFSWSGTLLVKIWSGNKSGLNQHLFKVTSSEYPNWFIYEWTKFHLHKFQSIAAGKATTMGHIKRNDLKSSKVLIPDKVSFDKFNKIMSPIYEKRLELIKENQSLMTFKENLLTKYF